MFGFVLFFLLIFLPFLSVPSFDLPSAKGLRVHASMNDAALQHCVRAHCLLFIWACVSSAISNQRKQRIINTISQTHTPKGRALRTFNRVQDISFLPYVHLRRTYDRHSSPSPMWFQMRVLVMENNEVAKQTWHTQITTATTHSPFNADRMLSYAHTHTHTHVLIRWRRNKI